MKYRHPLLFLCVFFCGCAWGVVRQPDYTFASGAIGDAETVHCEQVRVFPTQPSLTEEVVRTRCTRNEGGHLPKIGWSAIVAIGLAIVGIFTP